MKPITINTHIDCSNNSKCCVGDILLATKQGAFESVFEHFLLTGCLHFVNHTPIDSYSKTQATVETATYGSEFVASKTATEQIIDLRHTLSYLGVPIITRSYLFGDNRSVVTSPTLPHSTLGKRHNILAYHQVREAIASKILAYHWIRTGYNLSDILSKLWDHPYDYEASDHKRTHHIDTKRSYSRPTILNISDQYYIMTNNSYSYNRE